MQTALLRTARLSVRKNLPYHGRLVAVRCLSEFQHARAQDLFDRITQKCSKEDMPLLANEIIKILGRDFRPNEFYYTGFGGKRVAAGAAGGEAEVPAAPEVKTSVDVKLAAYDAKAKIKVIKEVRAICGLGLKEAKELVESAPKIIQKDLKPEQAEELKAKLEEIGATIELV